MQLLLTFFLFLSTWILLPSYMLHHYSFNNYTMHLGFYILSNIQSFCILLFIIFIAIFIKNNLLRKAYLILVSFLYSFFLISNIVYFSIFKNYFDFFSLSIILENPKNGIGYVNNYMNIKHILFTIISTLFFYFLFNKINNILIKLTNKNLAKNKFTFINLNQKMQISIAIIISFIIIVSTYPYLFRKFIVYNTVSGKPLFLNFDSYTAIGLLQNFLKERRNIVRAMNPNKYDTSNANLKKAPKTVVLIINESWGKESIGIYNAPNENKKDFMHILSKLTQNNNSIIFKNHFTNAPNTLLSVTSLLTGLPVAETAQIYGMTPTFYSAFKASGYKTAFFTSQYYSFYQVSKKFFAENMDTFITGEDLKKQQINDVGIDDYFTFKAINDYFKSLNPDENIFIILNPNALHGPFQNKTGFPQFHFNQNTPRFQAASNITDIFISEVFKELDSIGRLDESFIWLIGDHGESVANSHGRTRLLNLNDEIINIPSILFYPNTWEKNPENKEKITKLRFNAENRNTQNLDIAPTMLALINLYSGEKQNNNQDILKNMTGKPLTNEIISADRAIYTTNYNSDWLTSLQKCDSVSLGKYRFLHSNPYGNEFLILAKIQSNQKIFGTSFLQKSKKNGYNY